MMYSPQVLDKVAGYTCTTTPLLQVLDKVAERVAIGPHKGEYQLRSEFRMAS